MIPAESKVEVVKLLRKYDVAFHRNLYTCASCTLGVCLDRTENELTLCVGKIGTLYVSRITKSNQNNRRVQEARLGDAGPDDANTAIYCEERGAWVTPNSKGSRRVPGGDGGKRKSKRSSSQ